MRYHGGSFFALRSEDIVTKPFDKHFLTIDQQLQRLISRGMEIGDRASAVHALSTIGYYRLSGYPLCQCR